jgi:hypothetical protein
VRAESIGDHDGDRTMDFSVQTGTMGWQSHLTPRVGGSEDSMVTLTSIISLSSSKVRHGSPHHTGKQNICRTPARPIFSKTVADQQSDDSIDYKGRSVLSIRSAIVTLRTVGKGRDEPKSSSLICRFSHLMSALHRSV